MVAVEVLHKDPVERVLIEHDDVVEALAADRADQPFDISILPRRPRGNLKVTAGTVKKSMAAIWAAWFLRDVR